MAKLYEGEKLKFPIEFYQPKRFLFYFLVLQILAVIFFVYDLFFPTPTHRGELPSFIKLLIAIYCAFFAWLILKQLQQTKPFFAIYKSQIVINRLFKEPKIILWENVKAVHISHDRFARLTFEKVNAELFERQEFIPLQYLKLNDTQLNSREVENIFRQVFDNAKNNLDKPIVYQKVKLKFWDWY